ncbi:hypothetical protein TNCV_4264031 [Trichonephila clavipes]|nr:hypothetical protein TNCV_4264031 [Trichonephila clavipes]
MSHRKQRPAFDQVSEFDRGRIVAYRDCGLLSGKSVVMLDETKQLVECPQCIYCFAGNHTVNGAMNMDNGDVVFTDENRFCLQHHDDRIRGWRYGGERLLICCVIDRHTGVQKLRTRRFFH